MAWTSPTAAALGALASIDALLFVACIFLLTWAFGPVAGALVTLAWGTGVMWVFDHVGLPGSLGRLWWITSVVGAVCFLQKRWFIAAGTAVAAAAALRGYPGVFLVWPTVLAAAQFVRARTIAPELRRLLSGAAAGIMGFGAFSVIGVDPIDTYQAFLQNSPKHAASGASNYMGLDPMLRAGRDAVVWWIAAAGLTALAAGACRRVELPPAIALSGIFGMFILFPLSNYDYLITIVLVPFVLSRPRAPSRSDLLAYGVFVLLGNAIFLMAPGHNWFIYRTDSILVCWFLCYLAVQWASTSRLALRSGARQPAEESR